ncbi:MAG: TlpA disulfide reductase family protein [Gammaproteobacteria bacterium]|nr:TlpA disulfide reductase family protein [Gammaproteobacteria bacterium]
MKYRHRLVSVQSFMLLSTLLMLLLLDSVAAREPELPFGIREYSIGQAPNFELEDIDGAEFNLKSTRGRWVFLHFWASWCGPCRKEMPTIEALSKTLDADKLHFVLVNVAEEEDTIFKFLGIVAPNLTSLMDTDGQITEMWSPRGLPTTFLIDPEGRVRYQAVGGREWDQAAYLQFIRLLISQ